MADDALPICDYCGDVCGHNTDCNALSCTFTHCEGGVYHQDCLHQFFKANKLEKNRKTGFRCPRGCGKGSKWPSPCPGRIDKSHPIIPKNEDRAKKRQAAVVDAPPKPPRPDKAAEKAAGKARAEQERAQAAAAARAKEEEKIKAKANAVLFANPNKPVPARALASAIGERPVKAKHKSGPDLQVAQLLKDQALQEIGLLKPNNGAGPSRAVAAADKAVNGRAAGAAAGPSNATALWNGKAAAAQPEPLAPPPLTGTSLGDLLSLATIGKAKGRATPMERALSGGGSNSDGGSAASPIPPAAVPLDMQNAQHFPPVGAARAVSPGHNKAAAAAWPALAAAASPVAGNRLQRQGSESGFAPTLAAGFPDVHRAGEGPTANGNMAAGACDAAADLNAHLTLSAAGSGALLDNGDIPAQQQPQQEEDDAAKLSKAQRKNIKRAEKKKRHSVAELEELDVSGAGPVLEQQQPAAPTTPPPNIPAVAAKADTPGKLRSRKEPVVQEHLLEHADHQGQRQQAETHCTVSTRLSLEQQTASLSPSSGSPSTEADLASGSLQAHDEVHVGLLQHPSPFGELLRFQDTMHDMCVTELVTHKCRLLYQQLRRVGFPDWQAAAAIRAHGISIEPALEWLLVHRHATPQQLLGMAGAMPVPIVDINPEIAQLDAVLLACMSSAKPGGEDPRQELLQAVICSGGDVQMAAASVQQRAVRNNSNLLHLHQQQSSLQASTYYTARSDYTSLSRAHTMQSYGDAAWAPDDLHAALPQPSEPLSSTLSQLQPVLSTQHQLIDRAAGLSEAGASSQYNSLSHMGFPTSSTSLPGLLQQGTPVRQNTWGGTGQASLDAGMPDNYYLSAGDEAQGPQMHTPAWGEGSSTYSGVYSRQGVNGSMGTWESHGSADGVPPRAGRLLPTPAPDAGPDDAELDSLMALCAQ